ncbi:DDE-type integrase/transposase/recombinase [Paenibacillus sp. MER TA 81-3]|uniref:DDE-type integrase/transposase/recombinase n=1 Tax=Paenibacillus sp. MER TA 81-3 TaxID=2939573 RepID=UPI0034D95C14
MGYGCDGIQVRQWPKAYLSAILDLHDKSIVSYVFGCSNNNPLVFQTLKRALQEAQGSKPMLHSDRGFQYTSLDFKKLLDDNKMTHVPCWMMHR